MQISITSPLPQWLMFQLPVAAGLEPSNQIRERVNQPVIMTRSFGSCSSIHGGRLLGHHIKTIHFLSRLEQHQLLLKRESCTLARAVLARECHIDQQQCELSKNIDALRLLGAFLRIMEKSPMLKTALSQMIRQASSLASQAGRDAVQIDADVPPVTFPPKCNSTSGTGILAHLWSRQ